MGDREVVVQVDSVGEQIVLAAAMASAEHRAGLLRRLKPDHFQVPQHRAAWEALGELERRKLEYDPGTIRQLFGSRVDVDYLVKLEEARPGEAPNLEHHVDTMLWDATRVEVVNGPLSAFLEALRDNSAPRERICSLGRQVHEMLASHSDRRFLRDSNEVVRVMLDELHERRVGRAVYPYGIRALDFDENTGESRLAPGAKPGMVTVITGCSGSGKSTMAARIALSQAQKKRRVLYGAWEMGDVITAELLAVMSLSEKVDDSLPQISRQQLLRGKFDEAMANAIAHRATQIGQYVRFFENPFGREPGKKEDSWGTDGNNRNLDIVHQYISETAADIAIFDLAERCIENDEVSAEKRALFRYQAIAQETRCHLILLAQQRKDILERDDPHPTKEGIKGSGAWFEIADCILGIHRQAQFKAVPDDSIDVDVLKRRHGPWPIRVEIKWNPDRGWYGDGTTVPYEKMKTKAETSELDNFTGAIQNPDAAQTGTKAARHDGGRKKRK